ATFAVILAFLPVLALSGLAGRLFAPLAAAYALAVLASLVVALTLTPALAAMLLLGPRDNEQGGDGHDPPVASWARRQYERLIRRIVSHARPVLAATIVLTLAAAATLPLFGTTFLPDLKEGHFVLHTTTAPGTSLAESLRLGGLVSQALLKLPNVRSVGQHVGRAELADDTSGTHDSEFEVDLKPGLGGDAQEQAEDDIRRTVAAIPGVSASINTFLTERVEETLSGAAASVAIEVYGNDLDRIDQAAAAIADVVDDVPGAADVHVRAPAGVPVLSIELVGPALARFGFAPVDVLDAIRTAYRGDVVGQAQQGERAMDVLVVLGPSDRTRPEAVGDLPLRNAAGQYVRLRELARIGETSGRYQVLHKRAERIQTVAVNVRGRDIGSFVAAAKARVAAKVKLPPDVSVVYAGAAEAQEAAQRDLLLNASVAAGGIVLVLAMITRRWRNLVLVLANLPFAVIGGVVAALVTGGVLSLGSTVGFVTLFGITLRNSIMMLSHYQHLVEVEGREWGLATAVEGAVDRLVPIVMTTLVTALGLLPLALTLNEPGREIEGPMAVVILGGLVTSMVLNLVVLPTLALRFGRFESFPDEFREHGAAQP
ncbi:MAG TPA: efflux RND transporter permease subunit, partial [Stellaceae bacterium]|nr:efflux RND transporter permease subunit [Stellaceae bacterium]